MEHEHDAAKCAANRERREETLREEFHRNVTLRKENDALLVKVRHCNIMERKVESLQAELAETKAKLEASANPERTAGTRMDYGFTWAEASTVYGSTWTLKRKSTLGETPGEPAPRKPIKVRLESDGTKVTLHLE